MIDGGVSYNGRLVARSFGSDDPRMEFSVPSRDKVGAFKKKSLIKAIGGGRMLALFIFARRPRLSDCAMLGSPPC